MPEQGARVALELPDTDIDTDIERYRHTGARKALELPAASPAPYSHALMCYMSPGSTDRRTDRVH